MLPTEWSSRKFHVMWSFDMFIREWKLRLIFIPSIESIFKTRAKITNFHFLLLFLEKSLHNRIYFSVIKYHWNWDRKLSFWSPSKMIKIYFYPVAISGWREYDFYFIYCGGGILNFTYYLCNISDYDFLLYSIIIS